MRTESAAARGAPTCVFVPPPPRQAPRRIARRRLTSVWDTPAFSASLAPVGFSLTSCRSRSRPGGA